MHVIIKLPNRTTTFLNGDVNDVIDKVFAPDFTGTGLFHHVADPPKSEAGQVPLQNKTAKTG